jgi:hypothetical protein
MSTGGVSAGRPCEVPGEKLRGELLATLGEHGRLGLADGILDPAFAIQQLHEIPIHALPGTDDSVAPREALHK